MTNTSQPSKSPDAVFLAPPHDAALWNLPWIATATVTPAPDQPSSEPAELEVRLWFQPSDALPKPESLPPLAPVPDRAFDLEVHNAGHAPPQGFWRVHPRLEAYEVEYDPDDGGNWWARLWLKA